MGVERPADMKERVPEISLLERLCCDLRVFVRRFRLVVRAIVGHGCLVKVEFERME